MLDIHGTVRSYQQPRQYSNQIYQSITSYGSHKSSTSSRSQSIRSLPSIHIIKEQHNELLSPLAQNQHDYKLLDVNENEKQVSNPAITVETRKKPHPIVMPPIL